MVIFCHGGFVHCSVQALALLWEQLERYVLAEDVSGLIANVSHARS